MSDDNDDWLIEGLFRDYYDRMLNYAFRMTGNRDEAEDLLSYVFMTLAEEIRRGRTPANPSAWMYRCVGNRAISLNRRTMVRFSAIGEVWSWLTKTHAANQDRSTSEEMATVRQALLRLRDKDREVIILRYDEEFDFKAIAEILGISETGVRARLSRAMGRLRKEMEVKSGGR